MSMLYLASSIATSAVRRSGRSAPSRSRRVFTLHCPIVSSCLLPSDFPLSTEDEVLSNPGDGRSGMEFRAVLKCRWLLQFTSDTVSRNKYRSHTGKNMSRQAQTICPCSGWSRYVGSSIHQPPLMLPQ